MRPVLPCLVDKTAAYVSSYSNLAMVKLLAAASTATRSPHFQAHS